MSAEVDPIVEAYLDGSLDAEGAAALERALRSGGEEAVLIRERISFAGLLGQALDPADADAVARAVGERIDAEGQGTAFVRAVQSSLPRRRRARSATWVPFALAALLLLAIGGAWWLAQGRASVPTTLCVIAAADAGSAIERSGASLAAAPGAGLIPEDLVIAHGALAVRYADGSELSLADGTRLRVLGADARERLRLENGALAAEIAPQPAGRPFIIATAEASVEVVGTRFVVTAVAGRTRVDLERGRVRLTRTSDGRSITMAAGETASVAAGEDLVAKTSVPASTPHDALFPSRGFDGWMQQHGQWSNDGGVMRGIASGDSARLLSARAFRDLELTCRMRIVGASKAEVQVGDYNWFFTVPANGGGWIALRLVQRGEELSCTADGAALAPERGSGRRARPGPLSFYVMSGGTIEIADTHLVEPHASGGSP